MDKIPYYTDRGKKDKTILQRRNGNENENTLKNEQ